MQTALVRILYIYESLRYNFVKVYKVLGLTNLTSTSRTSCLIGIRVPGCCSEAVGGWGSEYMMRHSINRSIFLFYYSQIIKISISIIVIRADLFVCCNFFFVSF